MSVVCDCDCVGFEASQVPRGEGPSDNKDDHYEKKDTETETEKKQKTLCEMCHKKAMETPEDWIGLL